MNKKLKDIAKEYLSEIGQETPHTIRRVISAGIKVIDIMHYAATGVPKTDYFPVTANKQVLIPDDLVKLIEVYVMYNGVKSLLTESGDLGAIRTVDNCGTNELQTPLTTGVNLGTTTHYNKNGENIGRYYGMSGAGGTGHYFIDLENKVIQLGANLPYSQVMLSYISNPERINGNFMVDPMMEECLLAGIHWVTNRFKVSTGMAREMEINFENKRAEYVAMLQPAITKQGAISLARSGRKQSKF